MGFLDDVIGGAAAGAAAGGIIGGIAGAVGAGVGGAVAGAAAGAQAGAQAGAAAGAAGVGNVRPMLWRHLTNAEWSTGVTAFGSSLPSFNDIVVTDIIGLEGRPFTIPGLFLPVLGPVIPAFALAAATAPVLTTKYLLNLGADGFADALNYRLDRGNVPGQVLVHELTHVWQGRHSPVAFAYVIDSAKSQVCCGKRAYAYPRGAGRQWREYGAEQQAHIVEDWYAFGRKPALAIAEDYDRFRGDPRYDYIKLFRYIKHNIWPGRPNADSPSPDAVGVALRPDAGLKARVTAAAPAVPLRGAATLRNATGRTP